jgi:hypothetical protein
MRRVAKYLEEKSISCKESDEIDVFGRSAFSRYYYATFWVVRSTLGAIDPKWAEPAHSVIPDILRGAVKKKITVQLKAGLLPHSQSAELRARANGSVSSLASLLEKAYLLRVTADYKPELTAIKSGGIITFGEMKISEAANWPKLADTHTGNLLDVCRKLGII